jgi:hypothetical protein
MINVSTILDSLRCQLAAHGYHLTDDELLDVSRNVAQAQMASPLVKLLDALAELWDDEANGMALHQLHDRDGALIDELHAWCSAHGVEVEGRHMDSGSMRWSSHEVKLGSATVVVHDTRTHCHYEPPAATNPTDPTWSVAQHSMGEM